MAYYKIISGPAYEIAKAHNKEFDQAIKQINELAQKYFAQKDRYLGLGTKVIGLYFGFFAVPNGWKKTKPLGYCVPNKRTKLGQTIMADLDIIKLPSTEKLAIALGCNPFFMDFDDGRKYCANIDILQHDNVVYLDAHKWCPPSTKQYPEIIEIPASEWHKMVEDKDK